MQPILWYALQQHSIFLWGRRLDCRQSWARRHQPKETSKSPEWSIATCYEGPPPTLSMPIQKHQEVTGMEH